MDALNIQIGKESTWSLPAGEPIASIRAPRAHIQCMAQAIDSALSHPIEFPSLDQVLVPGDQLVLAVDPRLPALTEVLSATVSWFCEHGTPAANIRIVLAGEGEWETDELANAIQAQTKLSIPVERHDCDDSEKIAYVAANEASDPIYLNRSVVDADVVIPITCARPQSSLDYFGPFSLFPLLSNRATRGEFYSLPRLKEPTAHARLQSWADQAAWWVGVLVGIQIIPAADDRVAVVLAGQLQPLEDAAQQLMSEHWSWPGNGSSDLVVALVDSPANSQSWLSVARVLFSALRSVTPHGSIVIATQLKAAIGKGLGRLRDPHRDPEAIARKLASDDHDDAVAAAVILSAIASNHVYLISDLRTEMVESLGLGAITAADQLTRLVSQHTSCTVIESAQHRGLGLCPS